MYFEKVKIPYNYEFWRYSFKKRQIKNVSMWPVICIPGVTFIMVTLRVYIHTSDCSSQLSSSTSDFHASLVVKWSGSTGDWTPFSLVSSVGAGDPGLEDGSSLEVVLPLLFSFKVVFFWMGVSLSVGVLKISSMYSLSLGPADTTASVVRIGSGATLLFLREFLLVLDGEKSSWPSSPGIRGLKLVFLCRW